jgi:hypothetical protein
MAFTPYVYEDIGELVRASDERVWVLFAHHCRAQQDDPPSSALEQILRRQPTDCDSSLAAAAALDHRTPIFSLALRDDVVLPLGVMTVCVRVEPLPVLSSTALVVCRNGRGYRAPSR